MKAENYHKIFEEQKCCVLIPTYNNAPVLENVINDVLQYTHNVIVINDGSTDNTLSILKKFNEIKVASYKNNKGKGFALKTGFKFAEEQGYEYAISIDSDGQHFAKDLPQFLNKLSENKNAIIIGARNMDGQDQKQGSSFANKFSNFWFLVETAIKHPDTQSGYRLYPLKKVNKLHYFTNKYEFEIEVIVRNSWRGIDIEAVPISVFYPDKNERITHFRPLKDFFRISVLNTILVIGALLFGLPARLFHSAKKKGLKRIIKEDILQTKDSNLKISSAIGFGFFMGIVPIWGWQIIVSIALSQYFKLNKAIVLLAAHISIPPMIPFIIFGSFYAGGLVLGKNLDLLHFTNNFNLKTVTQDLLQYALGAIILAIIVGLITFAISFVLLNFFRKKKS